jgi:hypothetical protein
MHVDLNFGIGGTRVKLALRVSSGRNCLSDPINVQASGKICVKLVFISHGFRIVSVAAAEAARFFDFARDDGGCLAWFRSTGCGRMDLFNIPGGKCKKHRTPFALLKRKVWRPEATRCGTREGRSLGCARDDVGLFGLVSFE